jgi:hypothetical protein
MLLLILNFFSYYYYGVGFCYTVQGSTNLKGIVTTRGSANLDTTSLDIQWKETDIAVLSDNCYDIWTETNKPKLYLNTEGDKRYLIVTVLGKCNAIYKLELKDGTEYSPVRTITLDLNTVVAGCKITSTVYNPSKNQLFFTCKTFNKDESYLYPVDMNGEMKLGSGKKLNANESLPTLSIDTKNNHVYLATAGFNKIYKFNTDLTQVGIAVLPYALSSVSSMVIVNESLYIVTSEPNAQVGRIPIGYFCDRFCGEHSFCDGKNNCVCVKDYEKDPAGQCLPKHIVQYQDIISTEKGTAAAFGVLFAFAVIAGIAGWFLWFRRSSYQGI